MSLSLAKHAAHMAKYDSHNDTERVEHLVEAVHQLTIAVSDQANEIEALSRKLNRSK